MPTRWFPRFRLRTLLGLMLLVAVAAGGWRIYGQWRIKQAIDARDAALADWRQVYERYLQADASFAAERESRRAYFERRREAEVAIQRVW